MEKIKIYAAKILMIVFFTLIGYTFLFGRYPDIGFCLVATDTECLGLLEFMPPIVKLIGTAIIFTYTGYMMMKEV